MAPRSRSAVIVVQCADGDTTISNRVLRILLEDGYIFRKLLMGGDGFSSQGLLRESTVDLSNYVTKSAFNALTCMCRMHMRVDDLGAVALQLEHLGGFRSVDAIVAAHPVMNAEYNPMTPRDDVYDRYIWRIHREWSVPEEYSVTCRVASDHSPDVYCRKRRYDNVV